MTYIRLTPCTIGVGFDSPLMYAAHRAAGSMTSLYRNLGTGCEHLFKQIIKDEFDLTDADIRWTYVATSEEVQAFAGDSQPTIDFSDVSEIAGAAEDLDEAPVKSGKKQGKKTNTLDAHIDLTAIRSRERAERFRTWLSDLKSAQEVTWEPLGAVFEVRQGYKSMDSKRQAADIANAAQALTRQRLPVLVVMSRQIDDVLVRRYRASGWGLLRGLIDESDPLASTFAFFDEIVGYDLISFFNRNHAQMRTEVEEVLRTLLGASS